MNIYLVYRTDAYSYDDYDSFVCFAGNEQEARELSPATGKKITDAELNYWDSSWVHSMDSVVAIKLGVLGKDVHIPIEYLNSERFHSNIKPNPIICSSFNAG